MIGIKLWVCAPIFEISGARVDSFEFRVFLVGKYQIEHSRSIG